MLVSRIKSKETVEEKNVGIQVSRMLVTSLLFNNAYSLHSFQFRVDFIVDFIALFISNICVPGRSQLPS